MELVNAPGFPLDCERHRRASPPRPDRQPDGKPMPATQTTNAQVNIETIVRLEEEAERGGSFAEHMSETIGRFVGTLSFVVVQVAFVVVWIAVNAWRDNFDPYPFPFLGGLLAFEAVTLTAFVLIRQNRMSLRADRRNHLALQITLLSEQEATKIIQMLERMSRQLGMEHQVTDRESRELSGDTSIDGIARDLQTEMEEDAKGKK
jgi:uncharacterized membrane protein